jgi:hypothetical protein
MSEQEIKKAGELEDSLGLTKVEISEVTITEYRKNQIVRMGECVIGLGLIGAGVGLRKKIPAWLSLSFGVVGAGMTIYNGRNLYLNFKQDGKLIREAIKMKKVEEKKIRDERKKKPETPPVSEEKKSEQPSPSKNEASSQKPDAVKSLVGSGNNNGNPTIKKETPNGTPSTNGKSNGAVEAKASNEVEVVLKNTRASNSHQASILMIVESDKKEGEEIIANISTEEKPESASVEATIIIPAEEKISIQENGREALR